MNIYKAVEIFAGAGGMALGLEKAGFDVVGLVEINKWASQTLKFNRPNWNVINSDIKEVLRKGIKNYIPKCEIDLLSGGYPCQSFSYAGNGLGINDSRGTLFYEFTNVLNELTPKIFFAENVKGLASHDQGKTLKTMIKIFESSGYRVIYKILNAIDYGVAQKRERIILIGIRNDIHNVMGDKFNFLNKNKKNLTLKDVLQNVPESLCAKYSEKKVKIMKLVPPGGCWRDLEEEIAKAYMKSSYYLKGGKTGMARRLSWNEPSLTVLCSPSQKQTERCHPDEIRPFSVRENARIQSFPDDWHFCGSMYEQYKQIGNALPPNVAENIGLSIRNFLDIYIKTNEKL